MLRAPFLATGGPCASADHRLQVGERPVPLRVISAEGLVMPPRFPIVSTSSSEVRSAALLLIGTIVITGLYVGRGVLLPLAFAILLSFVLTPALLFLRLLTVPRVLGVTIVVARAFALIFPLGWLL